MMHDYQLRAIRDKHDSGAVLSREAIGFLLDELETMRAVPPKLRIEGSWLVEEVDYHTCGQGESGHYGAHEPDCGLIPLVDPSDVPGWPK